MDPKYPGILSDEELTTKKELKAKLVKKQERRGSGLNSDDEYLLAEVKHCLERHNAAVAQKKDDELRAQKHATEMASTLTIGELQELHLKFSATFAEELKALETWKDLDPQITAIARARVALLSRMFGAFTDIYRTAGISYNECTNAAGHPARIADQMEHQYEQFSMLAAFQGRYR
jgi:predicted secreted protein